MTSAPDLLARPLRSLYSLSRSSLLEMARFEMDMGLEVVRACLQRQMIFASDVSDVFTRYLSGDSRYTCWNYGDAES